MGDCGFGSTVATSASIAEWMAATCRGMRWVVREAAREVAVTRKLKALVGHLGRVALVELARQVRRDCVLGRGDVTAAAADRRRAAHRRRCLEGGMG